LKPSVNRLRPTQSLGLKSQLSRNSVLQDRRF
jgi:hypothetical protein